MILGDAVTLSVPALTGILAVILRRRMWLRYLSVFMLLTMFAIIVYGGLRNVPPVAARMPSAPSYETRQQEVPYAQAWHEGTMRTQEMVNNYFDCLLLWPATLAVLALVAVPKSKTLRKKTTAKTTITRSEQ